MNVGCVLKTNAFLCLRVTDGEEVDTELAGSWVASWRCLSDLNAQDVFKEESAHLFGREGEGRVEGEGVCGGGWGGGGQ